MPEHADTYVGTRLRENRKRRGLSQKALADASGVSLSLIRQLEQGQRHMTRMETAHKLARALRVHTSHLLNQGDAQSPDPAEPWVSLRQAIEAPATEPDEEPTIAGVQALLPVIRKAYFAHRLSELSTLLGPALRDADALGDSQPARALRAHLLHLAGSTLTQVHQFDAAETALRRALDDAPDRLRGAGVIATWSWLHLRQGRLDQARTLATRWADDTEPRISRATPEELAAWGWLLLQASAACLRDNRRGEAADTMRLAQAVSHLTGGELPRGRERLTTWGPTTVSYKAAERYVVLDQPDRVVAMARNSTGSQKASTEYWRHRLDVAKAHTMVRQHAEAVDTLSTIHEQAPEWLTSQRYAQDILSDVINQRRTLTPQMRDLAEAMSVSF
ncbi:helix-turn-helix domain-containing protein [Streptomyces sp. NPDC020883]|uniref:helix-turn-helix domain-containing protein n=1 Tax=Streptomyces sp. NPDC020883 TaxID=3365099 RepID=UPI003787D2D1